MPDLSVILADAAWLPMRFDYEAGRVLFARVSRATHRSMPFIANHRPGASDETTWIDAAALRNADIETGGLHFVFHTAFCRSTLLAKALDLPGTAMGYSEPGILNDLAIACARQKGSDMVRPIVDLLSRPHGPGEAVVVKPSNHANRILPLLMQARSDARALLLYGSLGAFLWSIAKKGLAGRVWARRLFVEIGEYAPLDIGMSPREMFELTDLHLAALAWLLHQRHFALLLQSPLGARMATLEADKFNENRARTLNALGDFYGLAIGEEAAEAVASGPVFQRHSKSGSDHAETVARETEAAASPVMEADIAFVEEWTGKIAAQTGLTIPVAKPLF